MILRKPYAFLIKNFKLIHAIMLGLAIYATYKTGVFISFFNTYVSNTNNVIGTDIVSTVFGPLLFFSPIIIIIASIVLLVVMIVKKKPYMFYIINTIIFIYMAIVFNVAKSTMSNMEVSLVDIRVIRAIRDLLTFGIIAEVISSLLIFVRTTGFDVKKFNFAKDMQEMEIKVDESDNEEFEVFVSVETNVIKRNINKKLRDAKYVYVENKFIINIIVLIIIVVLGALLYLNTSVYNKMLKQGVVFTSTYFSMKVNNAYTTTKNYNVVPLSGDVSLVVVAMDVRTLGNTGRGFDTANLSLVINNHHFYHTIKYKEAIFDLGNSYNGEVILSDFQEFLLVFEVPNLYLGKKMQLKYVDSYTQTGNRLLPKYLTINLKTSSLDDNVETKEYRIGETIDFSGSVLGNSKISIESFDVQTRYKIDYNFKPSNNETVLSTEYVRPTLTVNANKALIKIVGSMELDLNLSVSTIYNLFDLIRYFGTIEYEIGGTVKVQTLAYKRILPVKLKQDNVFYIETLEEVMSAERVTIIFNIRNKKYEYVLK